MYNTFVVINTSKQPYPQTEKKAVLPKIKPTTNPLMMLVACAPLAFNIITINIPTGINFLPVCQDTVCIN